MSGMKLPPGYHFEWGGQYENQQRAQKRLLIVFPVSVLLISALLYATFRNVKQDGADPHDRALRVGRWHRSTLDSRD